MFLIHGCNHRARDYGGMSISAEGDHSEEYKTGQMINKLRPHDHWSLHSTFHSLIRMNWDNVHFLSQENKQYQSGSCQHKHGWLLKE